MYFQVLACIIANLPGLSVGLAMGFSAILIPQVSFIDADDNTVSTDPANLKVKKKPSMSLAYVIRFKWTDQLSLFLNLL